MSNRITPISFMTGSRYDAWYEKRTRQLRRERFYRYASAVAIVILAVVVAWVVVNAAMEVL